MDNLPTKARMVSNLSLGPRRSVRDTHSTSATLPSRRLPFQVAEELRLAVAVLSCQKYPVSRFCKMGCFGNDVRWIIVLVS